MEVQEKRESDLNTPLAYNQPLTPSTDDVIPYPIKRCIGGVQMRLHPDQSPEKKLVVFFGKSATDDGKSKA